MGAYEVTGNLVRIISTIPDASEAKGKLSLEGARAMARKLKDWESFKSPLLGNLPSLEEFSNGVRFQNFLKPGAFGSSFQHGYNTGVLNAPQVLITNWLRGCEKNMTAVTEDGSDVLVCEKDMKSATMIWAIIVSIFCVGGMIGGYCCGHYCITCWKKGGPHVE
ncbi:SLC2A1 [Lepeophtheirus salmonis]|uniref:SLC2A1 n=1 Tax=Lepeophtheirus salmonis TaxID=72036 RepID=A0A7R8CPC4_LEPSM|nr:SLC2A1 [Lepeophtheirus salmonis]CAF2848210.1 SLC2A1 [Lepeophtheirus salmonis]